MQLYSIASGSSGNCIYVGGEEARILIDAGISMKTDSGGLNGGKFSDRKPSCYFYYT